MKFCIYGSGAAGCAVGIRLLDYGADVTLIGRGTQYQTIRNKGLKFITKYGEKLYNPPITDKPESLGKQDCIIIATKSYSVPEIAPKFPSLMHQDTVVIPACNGIPWWFFYNLEGKLKNYHIKSVNPEYIIDNFIPFEKVIGGLFYMAATTESPGVVSNYAGPKFLIGEPGGEKTDRIKKIAEIFEPAGFKDTIADNIRTEIWRKLCWNTPFNPLAVIFQKDSGEMADNPEISEIARNMMREMIKLADNTGVKINLDIENHINLARIAGTHKPSMLQDFEHGRRIEIEAIIGSVCEIADEAQVNIPDIKNIYNRLRNKIKTIS